MVGLVAGVACRAQTTAVPAATPAVVSAPAVHTATPTATPAVTATPHTTRPTPLAAATPTPIYSGPLSPPCGVTLPALLPTADTAATPLTPAAPLDEAALRALIPEAAWPAMQRLLDAPASVGLVAYQLGRESEGVFWNADTPMPLISVAKVITLAAYAEALAVGELNAQETVPLTELDRFYLPNFDLGAHRRAVAELRQEGRLISSDDNPAVTMDDVAWMMMRHSSNAAADYLHLRLGQARIEATALALGLGEPAGSPAGLSSRPADLSSRPADLSSRHSAPCPFLGQFLLMANHSRGSANDRAALAAYVDDPAAFGRDAALLTDAYTGQATFRAAEVAWRERNRRPSIDTQRFFAAELAPRGTARAYAALMARLAQNGLSNADSSFQARRILEWPNQFDANQALFSNVGYKNGALPGVLTTVYYVYRWDDPAPVVVALFYRDLPQNTYRQWRNALPHDELARWLLADPAAIGALRALGVSREQ